MSTATSVLHILPEYVRIKQDKCNAENFFKKTEES